MTTDKQAIMSVDVACGQLQFSKEISSFFFAFLLTKSNPKVVFVYNLLLSWILLRQIPISVLQTVAIKKICQSHSNYSLLKLTWCLMLTLVTQEM